MFGKENFRLFNVNIFWLKRTFNYSPESNNIYAKKSTRIFKSEVIYDVDSSSKYVGLHF